MTEAAGTDRPLAALLAELALASPGVEGTATADGAEYAAGGRVFATVEGEAASFRLGGDVAGAAARTAGVSTSRRGPEWVTLTALELDRYTRDRAVAWFELAYRLAETP